MSRKRTAAAETEPQTSGRAADEVVKNAQQPPEMDVFDQQIAARAEVLQSQPVEQPQAGKHAAQVEKKQYTPPADPLGFENIKGEGNRVRLLKSEGHQAWVIRFEKPPNEMESYSKENPHPVIKMLKDEGYRWGFDNGDGKGGWGKAWSGDPYGTDHLEARKVLEKAAEMIGAKIEQGQSVA